MKETDEIMGMIKEEGAAYFARERGNKVEVGLYLEHLIEERGMKKKDIVRKLNLEESYARKLFGGQRIPTRKILLQCAFLLSLNLADTQRLLDIGQKPRLYPRVRYADQSNAVLSQIRFFFGDTFGTYYLVIGLGIFLLSLYIAGSKYGDIVLGEKGEKPKYSFFSWGAMMFTCGLAADILFYSFSEWVLYATDPHLEEISISSVFSS